MEKKTRKSFNCKRCYQSFKSGNARPKYCGKCKSSLWNQARTYAVVGGEMPAKKRTKATGKAARNAPAVSTLPSDGVSDLTRKYKLLRDVIFAKDQYLRNEWAMCEEVEQGYVNDRYPSGRERGKFWDTLLEQDSKEIHFWINRFAETDGRAERDSDAYRFYFESPAGKEIVQSITRKVADRLFELKVLIQAIQDDKNHAKRRDLAFYQNDLLELEKAIRAKVSIEFLQGMGFYILWLDCPNRENILRGHFESKRKAENYAKSRCWKIQK